LKSVKASLPEPALTPLSRALIMDADSKRRELVKGWPALGTPHPSLAYSETWRTDDWAPRRGTAARTGEGFLIEMVFQQLQPCPADGDLPDELRSLFLPPPAETWKTIVARERRLNRGAHEAIAGTSTGSVCAACGSC